jgi:predicted amidohydrolase YtcJ
MAARLTAYVVVAIVAATLIAGLIVGAQRDDNSGPVDLIIYNAKVYAADPLGSLAQAVAVRGNTILHVGTSREILRYRRPQTSVIDAKGVAVLPGFIDAHASFIDGGLARERVTLFDLDTVDSMQQRIAEWAEAHPDAGWIAGGGWTYERFADLPTRTQLDTAVKDRPVIMSSQDGHAAWVNTKALQAAGISKRTVNPENGVIVRDPRTGDPTGLLKDSAVDLIARVMPQPAHNERARALRRAIREAHEHGITSVQDFGCSTENFPIYEEARRAGDLTIRVYASSPVGTPGCADDRLGDQPLLREVDDPLLKKGPAVIALDGAIESLTASMLQPYARGGGNGLLKYSPDELGRMVRALDSHGWQIAIEADGDQATRTALDAFEAIGSDRAAPARGRRHRIEGAEIIDAEDLPRLGSLGVVASLQPLHSGGDRMRAWWRNVGPDRASLGWASRSLLESGAHMAFGTDWPNLPLDPLAGLHAAVHRAPSSSEDAAETEPGGDVRYYTGEQLPLKSAINAWTSGAAWASFDEHRKGMIKRGMLADLIILSSNIFSGTPESLESTEVMITIFDGKVVYQRDQRHSTN